MLNHTETQLFPELHGVFLANPELLDTFDGGLSAEPDWLQLFSETDAGDRVARAGIVIPVLGLEAGYYAVTVREAQVQSPIVGQPYACSKGWVLHVTAASLVLGGVGYLKRWNPAHPKLRRMAVPAGWYAVAVSLGAAAGEDDYALDFELHRCSVPPPFAADLGASLRA